jgi:hypothetical protein
MIYGHCITAILVRPSMCIQKYFAIAICSVSDKVTIRICDILHYTLYHLHHNNQSFEAFGMSPARDAVSFGTFFEYHTVLRASRLQESNGCTSWFMLWNECRPVNRGVFNDAISTVWVIMYPML